MIDESERSAVTESARESAGSHGPAHDAHRAISSMILAGMRGGPTWAKVLLAMFGVAAIVAVVISSLLLARDEPYLAFWVFAIASVFFVLALLVLLRLAVTGEPPPPAGYRLWSRWMPRQPLQPNDVVKELGRRLDDLRIRAIAKVLPVWDRLRGLLPDSLSLRLMNRYLSDLVPDLLAYWAHPVTRQAIGSRLGGQLDSRRKTLVIAHSMGSIIAYDVLQSRDVDALITIGSPLGVPSVWHQGPYGLKYPPLRR